MELPLESYWGLSGDTFVHRMISEGSFELLSLYEMRYTSPLEIYPSDANEMCVLAERIGDLNVLEKTCFPNISDYIDRSYNTSAPIEAAFNNHDVRAQQFVALEIAKLGHSSVFTPRMPLYKQLAYVVSVNDMSSLDYIINSNPVEDIIACEAVDKKDPLLSLAYRYQNLDIASRLHSLTDRSGKKLKFKPRYLVQNMRLMPVQDFLRHVSVETAFVDKSAAKSLVLTIYNSTSNTIFLEQGLQDICALLRLHMYSDSTEVLDYELNRCNLYIKDPHVRMLIETVLAYSLTLPGFVRIYITKGNMEDSFHSPSKPHYPFHVHTIFISRRNEFVTVNLIHELGHLLDHIVNSNNGFPYKGNYQKEEFQKAISEFLDHVAILLLKITPSGTDIETKANELRESAVTRICEAKFQTMYGSKARGSKLINGLKKKGLNTTAIDRIRNDYCSQAVVFLLHRLYEWAGRIKDDKLAELINRLTEILAYIEVENIPSEEKKLIMEVLTPLIKLYDKQYKPLLTAFSKTTQCDRSIFFNSEIESSCSKNVKPIEPTKTPAVSLTNAKNWSYKLILALASSTLISVTLFAARKLYKSKRRTLDYERNLDV